ncbi:MAG: flagellar hook-associated protein FlgL, partial [Thermodesulfobacteriota bacterium]
MIRVTHNMIFGSLNSGIQRNSMDLFETQEKISTGKDVNRPSDDPAAMSKIMGYNHVISSLEQFAENISYAKAELSYAETALSGTTDSLIRLKELAVTMADSIDSPELRADVSFEVTRIIEGITALANTNVSERYIFAGFLTDTTPFDTSGAYFGDSGVSAVEISPGATFAYSLTGERVFSGVGIAGGVDIFEIANDFNTALLADDTAGIQTAITELDAAI